MSNIIDFPIDIRYRVYGLHRDGRIIVQILNSTKRFIMHAENIVADKELISNFSKKQVQWLCDIIEINTNDDKEHAV